MRRLVAIGFVIAVAATVLAACGGSKPQELDPNIVPTNYKKEILDTLTRTLDDPTNVHEAFISAPVLAKAGTEQRYTACVRYNARDVNLRYRIAYFYGGRLNQLVEATSEQCGKAAYQPFPELEKLCLVAKCN